MTTLKKILLGSLLLIGCSQSEEEVSSRRLKEKDFSNATWIKAPYKGEIWNSYMGESISRIGNWALYKEEVARKNGFRYSDKNGVAYIEGIKMEDQVSLPDLDCNGYVVSGKDTIRKKSIQNP